MKTLLKSLVLGLWVLALSSSLGAQWSADPALNLAIADASGDQVQPKLVATSDGGCYVSWFDSIGNGFDVRLQRLDVSGNELWGHNGVLVADRGFSSTQDYALDVDAAGHALLAFRDDGFSGVQVTAARVSPAGSLDWGSSGVQLTNTTAFVAAPTIAGASDGEIVVAWTQDSSTHVQRLNSAGVSQWAADVVLTPATGSYFASDMHGTGVDVILSLVHQTGNFLSPKRLVAQKFDPLGAALWGTSPVSIFDSGSLQIGNFPDFETDGSEGAVFAWYGTSPLQSYAQHLLADGTEAFPHNGSAGSTNSSQLRVSPSVEYDSVSGETYMFWEETNTGQSQLGLSGQKFDSAGVAQWGAHGLTLIPVGPGEVRDVRTVVNGGGCFVFWTEIPSFGTDTMKGRHVDAAGTTDIATFDVCSVASGKSRLDVDLGTTGQVMLAWSDKRTDTGDIYAQNVNGDGSLGLPLGSSYCFGNGCPCGNDDPLAGCANSTGVGARVAARGSTSVVADDLIISGSDLKPSGPALLFSGTIQVAGGSGLPFGDGLRCAGGSVKRLGVRFSSPSGDATWGPGLVAVGGWVASGDTRYMQIWLRDPVGGPCSSGFNTSHAVELLFGP